MKSTTSKGSFMHTVGDAIERVGEIVTKMGAAKLGTRIYNFGNKVEHSRE